jgi:hypothetical protein
MKEINPTGLTDSECRSRAGGDTENFMGRNWFRFHPVNPEHPVNPV